VITLVLGGARSGKSAVAERLVAGQAAPVTYLATGVVADGDADFAARVAEHRTRRPSSWTTVEAGADLVGAIKGVGEGVALVDSLGTWIAANADLDVDTEALIDALLASAADVIVVSDEVGLGVHPATDVGRRFRDVLGDVNQAVAAIADEVLLVIAGRVLPLDALPEPG
jgi:adenosyl cobinamide kinase/adenosyl cobinamide phosphate guanylyltransferase